MFGNYNIRRIIKEEVDKERIDMLGFPSNWELIERYDNAAIFEDDKGIFNISVDYNDNYGTFEIWFNQMRGEKTLVKSYTTIADTWENAIEEAKKMGKYLNDNLPTS